MPHSRNPRRLRIHFKLVSRNIQAMRAYLQTFRENGSHAALRDDLQENLQLPSAASPIRLRGSRNMRQNWHSQGFRTWNIEPCLLNVGLRGRGNGFRIRMDEAKTRVSVWSKRERRNG
ncbi:hypothetical protein E4U54_008090 [Claviceps lovelessii]|nr:hypothetical protein E4U54_008090 [Claviceps lovelessii]